MDSHTWQCGPELDWIDWCYIRLLVTELHTDCFTFQTWKLQPCFCPAFYPGGVYAIVANVVCIYTWVCTLVPSQGNWAVDVGLGADPSESKCVQTEPRKGKIHILYSGRILYILSEYFERDYAVQLVTLYLTGALSLLMTGWPKHPGHGTALQIQKTSCRQVINNSSFSVFLLLPMMPGV